MATRRGKPAKSTSQFDVPAILAALQQLGTKAGRDGLARYGITAPKSFGVAMAKIQALGKQVGPRPDLVDELWDTGWYDARLLCSFVHDAAKVTPRQMERWCRDFDNWGIVDTLCFKLWDRCPHAFAKVDAWAKAKGEFQRRASPVLLACLALHDRAAPDQEFVRRLPLLEAMASDGRNFVKKGVLWALNGMGRRPGVRGATLQLCERLAGSDDQTARWIGRNANRALLK